MDFPSYKETQILGELNTFPFNNIKDIPKFTKLIMDAYPTVDIFMQLKKMKVWLSCHPPKKRYDRFICNWLNKTKR
jgi:hypothetical protein